MLTSSLVNVNNSLLKLSLIAQILAPLAGWPRFKAFIIIAKFWSGCYHHREALATIMCF